MNCDFLLAYKDAFNKSKYGLDACYVLSRAIDDLKINCQMGM